MGAPATDSTGLDNIYAHDSLGPWLQRASVDERLAFLASVPDRRPEGATDEELHQVASFKAALLEAEGLSDPPSGFLAFYYTQGALLRFLRAKGTEERALAAVCKTLQWARTQLLDMLRQHEQEDHPWHKELLRRYKPDGPFGVDRRGAPVFYLRFGLTDFGGLSREVTPECHQRFSVNKMNRDSMMFFAANQLVDPEQAWLGNVFVLDMAGMTMKRGGESLEFCMWMGDNVLTDHFPEVTKVTFIVNAPWFFSMGWALITPFIPTRTRDKFKIFSSRYDFMSELSEFVHPDQVPSWLGGSSTARWEYGEGGDVPEGVGRLETEPAGAAHRLRKPSWMAAAKAAALRSAGATAGPDVSASSSHRPRQPSWMAQAAMAVASRAKGRGKMGRSGGGSASACPFNRRDDTGQFDPDDRSIGPPTSATSQPLPQRLGQAPAAQEDATAQPPARGEAFPLELLLLALAAYALHSLIRNTGVGGFTSLVALLGAITGGQFAKQASKDVILRGRMKQELQKLGQTVTSSFVLLRGDAGLDGSCSLVKKRSSRGGTEVAPASTKPGPGGSPVESQAEAEETCADSLEARALHVLIEFSEQFDGVFFSWPSCILAWATDRSRWLHSGFQPPTPGWKNDLPCQQSGKEAPTAHSLPVKLLDPLLEDSE